MSKIDYQQVALVLRALCNFAEGQPRPRADQKSRMSIRMALLINALHDNETLERVRRKYGYKNRMFWDEVKRVKRHPIFSKILICSRAEITSDKAGFDGKPIKEIVKK